MRKMKNTHRILLGNALEKCHLEHQEGDGRISERQIVRIRSCPVVDFGISNFASSGSATVKLSLSTGTAPL
jgi:hypothetical protein